MLQLYNLKDTTWTLVVEKTQLFYLCSQLLKIFKYLQLLDIVVVDNAYLPNNKKRFSLIYIFLCVTTNNRIKVQVNLNKNERIIRLSYNNLYPVSIVYEKEALDIYNIYFLYNIDIRRLFLDYNSTEYPLLKNIPVVGYKSLVYNYKVNNILWLKAVYS